MFKSPPKSLTNAHADYPLSQERSRAEIQSGQPLLKAAITFLSLFRRIGFYRVYADTRSTN
jgi:hypothetical protein